MPILDINEIREILPHRYPFLLVDRIVELEAEVVAARRATAAEHIIAEGFRKRVEAGATMSDALQAENERMRVALEEIDEESEILWRGRPRRSKSDGT